MFPEDVNIVGRCGLCPDDLTPSKSPRFFLCSCPLAQERPRSALELQLASSEGLQPRGRMTAEEQLERMKRHQRALVRERKRNLSQGEHSSTSQRSSSSSRLPSSSSDPPAAVGYPTPLRSSSRHREQQLHRNCC